jgi:hypothetical protein
VIDFLTRLLVLLRGHNDRILPLLGRLLVTLAAVGVTPANATPNGTWLSKPQIWFHSSNNTLEKVMQRIKEQQYKYVFLDVRNLPEADLLRATQAARAQQLSVIAWVQSPQYRGLGVEQIIQEARHADGLQVDDHYFTNYGLQDFNELRARYSKPIFCSIQPFQARLVPPSGCDQLDVQCYTPQQFKSCVGLADRLRAVVSLSTTNTLRYQSSLQGRSFNVFLWPFTDEYQR